MRGRGGRKRLGSYDEHHILIMVSNRIVGKKVLMPLVRHNLVKLVFAQRGGNKVWQTMVHQLL